MSVLERMQRRVYQRIQPKHEGNRIKLSRPTSTKTKHKQCRAMHGGLTLAENIENGYRRTGVLEPCCYQKVILQFHSAVGSLESKINRGRQHE